MTSIVKTDEVIENSNIASNNAHVFISRKSNATNPGVDWKYKYEIHWKKYQIKETDMRQKTATFTSPNYFDPTTGVYCVLFLCDSHEAFGGIIIDWDYDKDSGLYEYQCQDFSRVYQSKFDLITTRSNYRILQ